MGIVQRPEQPVEFAAIGNRHNRSVGRESTDTSVHAPTGHEIEAGNVAFRFRCAGKYCWHDKVGVAIQQRGHDGEVAIITGPAHHMRQQVHLIADTLPVFDQAMRQFLIVDGEAKFVPPGIAALVKEARNVDADPCPVRCPVLPIEWEAEGYVDKLVNLRLDRLVLEEPERQVVAREHCAGAVHDRNGGSSPQDIIERPDRLWREYKRLA